MVIDNVLEKTKDAKYKLILNLMAKHNVSIKEIIGLNVSDLKEDGLHVNGRVITPDSDMVRILAAYIYRNRKQLNNALFPGRKTDRLNEATIIMGIRNVAKKAGYKLADLGLNIGARSPGKKPVQLLRENVTLNDIVRFLREKQAKEA